MNIRILGLQLSLVKNSAGVIKAIRAGKVSPQAAARAFYNPLPKGSNTIYHPTEQIIENIIDRQNTINTAFRRGETHGKALKPNATNRFYARLRPYTSGPQPIIEGTEKFIKSRRNFDFGLLRKPVFLTPQDVAKGKARQFSKMSPPSSEMIPISETLQPTQWGSFVPETFSKSLLGVNPKVYPEFSFHPGYNEYVIPHMKAINEALSKNPSSNALMRAKDTALAIAKHEAMHGRTYKAPAENLLLRSKYLQRYLPRFRDKIERTGMAAGEALAHFYATQGTGKASQAARNLPIEKLKQMDPLLLERWQQGLSKLPQNIRDRILATRAHLQLHYGLF